MEDFSRLLRLNWKAKRQEHGDESNAEHFSIHFFLSRLTPHRLCLSNDFIRPRQYVRRNGEANLMRGFQIDDELELGWLLDRKIARLCAFQNLIDINRSAAVEVRQFRRIGHQTAILHVFSPRIYARQTVVCREIQDLFSVSAEYRVSCNRETACAPFRCGLKCAL